MSLEGLQLYWTQASWFLLKITFLMNCLGFWVTITRTSTSSRPEVFLRKGVLKMYSKFTGEHPCRSAISIKLFCNFIEISLRYGCSPVNLLHIFRTSFPKNTSEWLLLVFRIYPLKFHFSKASLKNSTTYLLWFNNWI